MSAPAWTPRPSGRAFEAIVTMTAADRVTLDAVEAVPAAIPHARRPCSTLVMKTVV